MTLPPPFGADLKTLVLAGSDPPSARARGRARSTRELPLVDKAFLPLHGQLVIEYVLDLLLQECGLTRVWVLAPERQLAQIPARHRFIPVPQQPDVPLFARLSAGSAAMAVNAGEPALVIFGDHPLTSLKALQIFLARCSELLEQADFFHALALQAPYREYAPWFRRTSVHTREMSGRASGFTLAIPSRLHHLHAFEQLYGVRKLERLEALFRLLLHMARWLGTDAPRGILDSVLLYLAKEMEKAGRGAGATIARRLEAWLAARVPVGRLERYATRVLGAERGVRLIPVAHGGIAIDVDFAEELEALEMHWDALCEIAARQDAALLAQ